MCVWLCVYLAACTLSVGVREFGWTMKLGFSGVFLCVMVSRLLAERKEVSVFYVCNDAQLAIRTGKVTEIVPKLGVKR